MRPRQPQYVKGKEGHRHDFQYPWQVYRRCRECGLKQYYFFCQSRWLKYKPPELIRSQDEAFMGHTERRMEFMEYCAQDFEACMGRVPEWKIA